MSVETKEKTKTQVKLPSKYAVIFLNDDYTTVDFVVGALVNVFNYDANTAYEKTVEVDREGEAVVAILPFEIAEHKAMIVHNEAKAHGYPFRIKIEEE